VGKKLKTARHGGARESAEFEGGGGRKNLGLGVKRVSWRGGGAQGGLQESEGKRSGLPRGGQWMSTRNQKKK